MAGQDYVHVQLTAAGKQMAGKGGSLHIVRGRLDLTFKAGETQRVTLAYDWNVVLAGQQYKGQPVFEIVPDPAPAAGATAIPPQASPSPAIPLRPASSPANETVHSSVPVNHPGVQAVQQHANPEAPAASAAPKAGGN